MRNTAGVPPARVGTGVHLPSPSAATASYGAVTSAGRCSRASVAGASGAATSSAAGVASLRLRALPSFVTFSTWSSTSATASSSSVTRSPPTSERRLSATNGPNHGTVRTANHELSAPVSASAAAPATQRERLRSAGAEEVVQPLGGGVGVRRPKGVKPKRNEDMVGRPLPYLSAPGVPPPKTSFSWHRSWPARAKAAGFRRPLRAASGQSLNRLLLRRGSLWRHTREGVSSRTRRSRSGPARRNGANRGTRWLRTM